MSSTDNGTLGDESLLDKNEGLLDKAGAAALLNVSVRTVEAWTAARRIPYVKLGEGRRGTIRFKASALRQWIDDQEVQAIDK